MLSGSSGTYGQQRVFASVGWGAAALVVTRMVDLGNRESLFTDYSVAFDSFFVFILLDIITVGLFSLPPVVKVDKEDDDGQGKGVGCRLAPVLATRKTAAFFVFCGVFGAFMSSMQFQFM